MAREMMDFGMTGHKVLKIVNGDFVIVPSTNEHQVQLLKNNKGDYKQTPTVCVGLATYEDDDNGPVNVKKEIVKQFMQDGMEVVALVPNPDALVNDTATLFEDAYYK